MGERTLSSTDDRKLVACPCCGRNCSSPTSVILRSTARSKASAKEEPECRRNFVVFAWASISTVIETSGAEAIFEVSSGDDRKLVARPRCGRNCSNPTSVILRSTAKSKASAKEGPECRRNFGVFEWASISGLCSHRNVRCRDRC